MQLETIPPEYQKVMDREANAKTVLDRIKHKIGVHSGKGGVGKTTVAVNLAATLAKKGYKVCLLDADVDCPNAGGFLGIKERFETKGSKLIPFRKYGTYILSVAFLLESEDSPVIFRGPAKHHMLVELLSKSELPELDYLIIDLPPGTSDIPLTAMKFFQLESVVFVSTPQKSAVNDTARSIHMARKLGVPVLGIIENMSGDIFGKKAVEELAKKLGIKFLFRMGLDRAISEAESRGEPVVLSDSGLFKKFSSIIK